MLWYEWERVSCELTARVTVIVRVLSNSSELLVIRDFTLIQEFPCDSSDNECILSAVLISFLSGSLDILIKETDRYCQRFKKCWNYSVIKWVIMPAVFYYERENNLVCLLVMIISTSLVMLGCIQASTLHRVFVSYYLSNDSAVSDIRLCWYRMREYRVTIK